MTLNNRADDIDTNTDNCDNCGSFELLPDDVVGELCCLECGYVCNDNELAMDGLEMSWGENPQNTPSEALGGAGMPISRPGEYSGKASDYRRRRRLDGRARFTPPQYIQSVARELEKFRVPKAMLERVHSILAEADSPRHGVVPLADQRPPLKGYSKLPEGKYEQSAYRKKALALAALAVDDSYGRPNTYRTLSVSMGVMDGDVVTLKKMISSRVPDRQMLRVRRAMSSNSDPSEMARELREIKLNAAMDHIHSFIHDIIIHDPSTPSGMVTALDIRERSLQVLKNSQEPIGGRSMGHGQYTSYSAHKATMLATFEAIKSLGLPIEFCRQLHKLVPVARMKTNMRRLGSWWREPGFADESDATGHA